MQVDRRRTLVRGVAIAAGAFGLVTVAAGSMVLFGPSAVQQRAGDVVAFVVWFNFWAGFSYVAAAVGIWRGQRWGRWLAWGIAGATALNALVFAWIVLRGAAFELRTVFALTFRAGFWAAIALVLQRLSSR